MHKIILDEQATKTLEELERIIWEVKNYPTEIKNMKESTERILNTMNILCEKTVALIYRICFELLPGTLSLERHFDQTHIERSDQRSSLRH